MRAKSDDGWGQIFRPMIIIAIICVLTSAIIARPSAAEISAVNSTGDITDVFNETDTIYYKATAINNGSQLVRIYVVTNYDLWPNGSFLNDVSSGYREVMTDPAGNIPVSVLWGNPHAGDYDVVADVNMDGLFNHSIDFIDNVSVVGFKVLSTPRPSVAASLGRMSPGDHPWDFGSDTGYTVIMQLNLSTDQYAGANVKSITIGSGGTGNEKKDVRVVYLVLDKDGDGLYDQDDTTLGYQAYPRDDGMLNFEIPGGIDIPISASRSFVLAYDMKNGSMGSTYYLDINLVSASDIGGTQSILVSGLPLRSGLLTITGEPVTTSTSTTSTSTTSVWVDECGSDQDCPVARCAARKISTYSCKADQRKGVNVCAANIAAVDCCGDGDCEEGFYCLNYDCAEVKVGGSGVNLDYILIGVSIIVVLVFAFGLFILVKNRSRKPWQQKDVYDELWDKLKDKWAGKGDKNSAQGGRDAVPDQKEGDGQKPDSANPQGGGKGQK